MGQGPGRPMEISAQRKVYMVKGGQIDFFMVKMHTSLMGLSSQHGPACPGSGSAPGNEETALVWQHSGDGVVGA